MTEPNTTTGHDQRTFQSYQGYTPIRSTSNTLTMPMRDDNQNNLNGHIAFGSKYITEGIKHDVGKPRIELIPPELIFETAKVLTKGAIKYSDRNWEKGIIYSRVFGALMRHMWDWWWGRDRDDETGESHLAHAACCIAFLIAYESRNMPDGLDDRPK